MNVASLELCKELFELGGESWRKGLTQYSQDFQPNGVTKNIPRYDLGYLLRKLPENMLCGLLLANDKTMCVLDVSYKREDRPSIMAKTPEDALCQLAIELFKQGILPTPQDYKET